MKYWYVFPRILSYFFVAYKVLLYVYEDDKVAMFFTKKGTVPYEDIKS